MEALWKIEDKWRVTTQEALLVFVCSALAVIGVCTLTILKRKTNRKIFVESPVTDNNNTKWVTVRRILMESMRWSDSNRWEEIGSSGGRSPVTARQSQNSVAEVWQRPILMGEKCELPRFSGLILYDQTGGLLHQYSSSQ
ncbi:uncharacterized protein LOC126669813 isoform X2 [Mercurialis annua]|nr:uncharacterized protein LOC126669813 isoform X2 [Mercurialis annua]